jgi:hypothetical protein
MNVTRAFAPPKAQHKRGHICTQEHSHHVPTFSTAHAFNTVVCSFVKPPLDVFLFEIDERGTMAFRWESVGGETRREMKKKVEQ